MELATYIREMQAHGYTIHFQYWDEFQGVWQMVDTELGNPVKEALMAGMHRIVLQPRPLKHVSITHTIDLKRYEQVNESTTAR